MTRRSRAVETLPPDVLERFADVGATPTETETILILEIVDLRNDLEAKLDALRSMHEGTDKAIEGLKSDHDETRKDLVELKQGFSNLEGRVDAVLGLVKPVDTSETDKRATERYEACISLGKTTVERFVTWYTAPLYALCVLLFVAKITGFSPTDIGVLISGFRGVQTIEAPDEPLKDPTVLDEMTSSPEP